MSMRKLFSGERGDTIVEVMIVLAVLGLSISIAYSTANKSLLEAREAQESSYAAELVASQVEQLRVLAGNSSSSPNNIYITNAFCINSSGNVTTGFTSNTQPITNFSAYPAGCEFNNLYYISVVWSNSPEDTFTVQAVWNDILGQGVDTSTLVYRVHKLP